VAPPDKDLIGWPIYGHLKKEIVRAIIFTILGKRRRKRKDEQEKYTDPF
jgi:hypothetical protein